MSSVEVVAGWLAGLAILGLYVCIGMMLYLGYTKSNVLLTLFKNSPGAITCAAHPGASAVAKARMIGCVGLVLAFPRFHLKHRLVSAEDLDNFPPVLRRQLVALYWSILGSFALLALLVGLRVWGAFE